jgi:diguanylate cyclase (GGDEF)-like protein
MTGRHRMNHKTHCRTGLRRRAGILLACAGLAWANAARPESPVYPRALAVTTAQQLASAIDGWASAVAPAIPALIGRPGQLAFEDFVGNVLRALEAYGSSDAHWARAQQLALAEGDLAKAAEIAIARGEIALIRGDYASVERLSTLLTELGERAHLKWAEASAEEYSGVLDRRHGKLDDATRHEQRSIELMRERGDEAGVATVLTNLGTIARDRGDYASALDWFMQALAIRERIDNRLELTLRNLALIYRDLGDDAATRRYFSRALEVAGRKGDSANYAATLGTFASYLADVREFEPALAAADESLAIGQATGNRPSVGFSLLDSGRALLGLGRLDEAAARLNEALAVGLGLDQHEIMARSRVALAETALANGDRKRARQFLEDTFASPQASDSKPLLIEAYALRERLASADGDSTAALGYAHAQATLREELLGTRANRRLSALETQYARSASEQKLALVTKDNQLQAARLDREQLERRYGVAMLAALTLLLGLLAWRFFGVRRLNRVLAMRNIEIEAKRAALSDANERLEYQAQQLYQAAISDPLTGVFNRGHLMRQLDGLLTDSQRDGKELALLLIDFDHFKQVNDTQGHIFGDRVLVTGVHALRESLEPGDVLGRYGGEEFVVAVRGRDDDEVLVIAERLRTCAADALRSFAPQLDPNATISIGIATLSHLPLPHKVTALIDAADHAVYAAKRAGRNQVVKAQQAA